jgi:hypothetical protein
MAKAIVVNKSGSIKNGPRPVDLKPHIACNKGLEVKISKRKAKEKIANPSENGDLVFL